MIDELSKIFHGVGIGPLSKILAVNAVFFSSSKELWVSIYIFRFVLKKLLVMWLYPGYRYSYPAAVLASDFDITAPMFSYGLHL